MNWLPVTAGLIVGLALGFVLGIWYVCHKLTAKWK